MKNIKILFLSLVCSLVLFACKDDDKFKGLLPPTADFNYTPEIPVEGIEILFYANPGEGSSKITSWNWNFGDESGATSNKRNPYYTFAKAGTYQVKLTVKNEAGEAIDVVKSVVVAPKPKEFISAIAWEFTTNTAVSKLNEGSNSPVIGDDGTIFYVEGNTNGGSNGRIVAVTEQGGTPTLKWATQLASYIPNAPSIGTDGHVYVTTWSNTNSVYKLNSATGAAMWSKGGSGVLGGSNTTPAVDAQGNIYHGSRFTAPNGGAFSWAPDGTKRWQVVNVGAFYAAPVLSKDESTVYFLNTQATEGKIWALKTADGTRKWTESVGMGSGIHGTSLSMDSEGTIYYTTNAHIVAVTDNGATGAVKWSAAVIGASNSGVVIGPNGDLYTGAGAGLVALNPADGAVKWTYPLTTAESVPAVDKEGNIYIGTTDGKLAVISPKGLLLKEFPLGTGAVNSPTITNDGTVYVEALAGNVIKLFKITVQDSGIANSFWPMKGRNLKNTSQSK